MADARPEATPPAVPPPETPPTGLTKVIIEVVVLALVVFGAGLIWATSRDTKPPTSTTGLAALGSAAVTTPSGLRFLDLAPGAGPSPKPGQMVVVHYHGRFTDGSVFDSSRTRGEVFKFHLGRSEVIKGWDEGVASMKVGGVRRLVVPADLAYGERGQGKIPPHATLVFDIELLGYE